MAKLFIDDVRNPVSDEYIVVRSYSEAVSWMRQNGCPGHISFDHDLGSNDKLDGIDVAKWMVNADLNTKGSFIPNHFSFNVHSANVIGAENIRGLLNNYLEVKRNDA